MAAQPRRIDREMGGKRIVMVHGSPFEPHNEYLYPNSKNLGRLAEIDADYVILGHTHYQTAQRIGRALVINPGSAGEPRDPRNHFQLSFAVLDTDSGEVTFTNFQDPTRAPVDPAIVPWASEPHSTQEPRQANTPFWQPDR
jgi:putative phosphoesterase